MNREEILAKIVAGRFLLVAEYRGGRAESRGFVDTKTGKACRNVILSYVVECTITGSYEKIMIRHRAPAAVSDPASAVISLRKGVVYVFENRIVDQRARDDHGLAWIARA